MLRPFIPTLLLAAQFLFLSNPSSAQSPTSSCPCTLRGSVLDAISGQPVPHALVRLSAPSPRAALTDSEGKFQFEGVPAGSTTLEAAKPGYLGNNGFGRLSSSVFSFELGPATMPAILKLIPEGAISGEVSDENGKPLEGFTVTVLFRGLQGKRLYPDHSHAAVTDDEGIFRIGGLQPGSYFLLARQNQTAVQTASSKSSIPSGYSPVFYPGSSESASAVPLKILPGRTVRANFSLKREPFVRLSGTVSGYTPQERVFLTLQDSSGMPENGEILFDSSTGSFHTKWIPSGTYTLAARSTIPVSVDAASVLSIALQRINATSTISGLHLALQPTLEIPVIVHGLPSNDPGNNQSFPLLLGLVPKDPTFLGSNHFASIADPESKGSSGDTQMMFRGVTPGIHEFIVGPEPNAAYYAESATWGSTDLLREDIVLDSSGSIPPMDVVLRDDGATMKGKVLSGETPLYTQVFLLTDNRRPISVEVGPDVTFEVSGLAPGLYHVFAVSRSADLDYEDAASLAKISSKIQEITLSPKQSAYINLELATVEE